MAFGLLLVLAVILRWSTKETRPASSEVSCSAFKPTADAECEGEDGVEEVLVYIRTFSS